MTLTAAAQRPWHNWAGTEMILPVRIEQPASAAEVRHSVRTARRDGLTIKAIGAGHSFTGIAVAPGVQLDLSRLRGLIAVDAQRQRVTLKAGTRLREIPALIGPHGLAMSNLGDVDAQTITGAISTGTHGTGIGFGSLSSQITALELVTADGDLITISEQVNPELFQAARVGLGALGIIVSVTLQCVPHLVLAAVESQQPVDQVVNTFAEQVHHHDHLEFFWFPHTEVAATKTNQRCPATTKLHPLPRWKKLVDDDLITNRLFGVICALGSGLPAIVPSVNALSARAMSQRHFTDRSSAVFTTRRAVRFREMEYGFELAQLPAVFNEVRQLITAERWRISFPLEIRASAADDSWLAMSYGRPSCYIAVHRYWRDDYREYFAGVEEIFRRHGGRPHWGKMHTQTAASLSGLYPRFPDFVAVRDRLDPDRIFSNPYLDRVLGR